MGPRLIVRESHGNKFEVLDPYLNAVETVHSDRLKKTKASDPILDKYIHEPSTLPLQSSPTPPPSHSTHQYNLRS